MQAWKRRLLIGLASVLLVAVLGILFAWVFNEFIVNLWWFSELGYGQYFWNRLLYRYLVFIFFGLVFFLIFFLNFWIASKYLGISTPARVAVDSRFRRLFQRFRTGALSVYLPLSILLAAIIALPLFYQWEQALLYLFSTESGLKDPAYGKDISYYLFSLPVYLTLFGRLLVAFGVVLLGVALLYWLERRILADQGQGLLRGARIHLSILVLCVFFLGAWYFNLQRHSLLYAHTHDLFFGPGYVEMRVALPLIWACLILLIGIAFSFVFYINTGKRSGLLASLAFSVLFGLALGGRYSPGLPNLVQRYIVEPNAMTLEAPYIKHNIEATLDAYRLRDVETREYPTQSPPWDMTSHTFQQDLQNIPVWDEQDALQVYETLQEIRTYYDFPGADVGRYIINGNYQQVFLSPREISFNKLPESAQTWVNQWLKYTHGYGAVMTPAAQRDAGPISWLMQGIPPRSEYGLEVAEPGIYYGLGHYHPVIAPNESRELSYSYNNTTVLSDYKGSGGVSVSTLFRKLAFAFYFNDQNIFYTTQTNSHSRLLFRRNIVERISELSPFLVLDDDPYLVVTPQRLYWIQDAYTTSSWYPYSQRYNNGINYIRNSVKIVVDAYNGTVDYYIADPQDPIIRAYARIYPTLFKTIDKMPQTLKGHMRYPRDIFDIQLEIYANYHQRDPEIFYKQEDRWVFPRLPEPERSGWGGGIITPYYVTLNLIDSDKLEFLLLAPLVPKAQDNLRALAIAGCDGDNYGKIYLYSFPKGMLVYGPVQANALIQQDPRVSEQVTLWDQQGTRVQRGRLIVLPLNGVVVYVQAIFLRAASGPQIPQLERFVLNQGQIVAMAPSLEGAFRALNDRVESQARSGGPAPGMPSSAPAINPQSSGTEEVPAIPREP